MPRLECSDCNALLHPQFSFCHRCGHPVDELEMLIKHYFVKGFKYTTIIDFLGKYHGIFVSLRWLKYKLKLYGLQKRNVSWSQNELSNRLLQKIDSSHCLLGYRMMWKLLHLEGFGVPRRRVATTLKQLDPIGCEMRRAHRLRRRKYLSKGPNWCWHLDGYDKLKPYGFPIHGCIDGFSRYVLWLKVVRSNNNPRKIVQLFLKFVSEHNFCPSQIRTDCGTENVILAAAQSFFANSLRSHLYGASQHNQRIESWWSFLRKSKTTWWMNFFKDLIENQMFTPGNRLQMECLWFCFSDLIQQELDELVEMWNTHHIRRSRHDTVSGIPSELYFLPDRFSAEDNKLSVPEWKVNEVHDYINQSNVADDSENVYQTYVAYVSEILDVMRPTKWRDALQLYIRLLTVADPVM